MAALSNRHVAYIFLMPCAVERLAPVLNELPAVRVTDATRTIAMQRNELYLTLTLLVVGIIGTAMAAASSTLFLGLLCAGAVSSYVTGRSHFYNARQFKFLINNPPVNNAPNIAQRRNSLPSMSSPARNPVRPNGQSNAPAPAPQSNLAERIIQAIRGAPQQQAQRA